MPFLRFRRAALLLATAALVLPACGSPDDGDDVEQLEEAQTAGPPTVLEDVTGSASFRVRAGGMSLWVDPTAKTTRGAGGLRLTVRFRTSVSLASAASWVPDDGFGSARLVSPRVVEVDLRDGHEINTMLSGLPLFVHLTTAGTPRDYDVRLDLAPRLTGFAGSSLVRVGAELRPVYVTHPTSTLRYRGAVTKTGATAMGTEIGGAPMPGLFPLGIGTGAFGFDWEYPRMEPAIGAPGAALFRATTKGSVTQKTAGISVAVTRVGLTVQGADQAWPQASCAADTKTCVKAGGDLGACGTYREVARCVDALACSFSLYPRSVTALNATKRAVNNACSSRVGSSCALKRFRSYDPGGCDEAASLDDVAAFVESESADDDQGVVWYPAKTLTRSQLAQTAYFSSYAPTLLAKLDAHAGPGNLVAKEYVAEIPCHNCHALAVRYVLFYTDTQRVVVVDGGYGYDS
jgi:hypothetical protein